MNHDPHSTAHGESNAPEDLSESGEGTVREGFPVRSPARTVMAELPAKKPYVTYTLLVITILVFLAQMGSQYLLGADYPVFFGAKVNELIELGQFWRFFTPMLLHGSIMHIGFNMYALMALGPGLERFYGHLRFLALYVVSGFAGNVFSMIFTEAPSLGSSTAIFGLLAAQGAFYYQNRELFGDRARSALINIITLAGINFVIGLSPGIDNWGHLGGFLAGAGFALLAGPLMVVEEKNPNMYELRDKRPAGRALLAVVLVGGAMAALAAVVLLQRVS